MNGINKQIGTDLFRKILLSFLFKALKQHHNLFNYSTILRNPFDRMGNGSSAKLAIPSRPNGTPEIGQ